MLSQKGNDSISRSVVTMHPDGSGLYRMTGCQLWHHQHTAVGPNKEVLLKQHI